MARRTPAPAIAKAASSSAAGTPNSSPGRQRKRARLRPDDGDAAVRAEDFSVLEFPHPYGVLPGGNRFLGCLPELDDRKQQQQQKQPPGPGALLSDEGWYQVAEFCSDRELGALLQSCRYFYAVASEPELWRDALLRALEPTTASSSSSQQRQQQKEQRRTIDVAGPSWKDTLVRILHPDRYAGPHRPIPVRGVYSDHLHRLHSCRSFAIPPSWRSDANLGDVDRVPWNDMTIDRFERQYEGRNVPVVIEGAARSWKAFERWNRPGYLVEKTRGQSFRATSGAAALPGRFGMEAYLRYCRSDTLEESPLYLFDRDALRPGSTLWNDWADDLKATCPYFDPSRVGTKHDLFQVLGEGSRPDHTWLIVGPRRSGSVFHIDPNATHAWNASIAGTKRWIFYPPGVTPPGVHPSGDGDRVALPLSLGEWIFQFWDEHERRKLAADPSDRPLEGTARPGDVVFVPHGYWHLVVNLDEINVAVTHNYASESNLPSVLKFLDEKRDQVSGCRDRNDSVKPDRLYETFVDRLRERYPEMTDRALRDPGWACRAWRSDPAARDGTGTGRDGGRVAKASRGRAPSRPRKDRPGGQCSSARGGSGASVMTQAKTGDGDGGFSFSFLPVS